VRRNTLTESNCRTDLHALARRSRQLRIRKRRNLFNSAEGLTSMNFPRSTLPKGNHPAFQPPTNPQIKIWRYMDFTQFVSMLDEKRLLFTRADLLEDKFEGTMSRPLHDFLLDQGDPQRSFCACAVPRLIARME
jgi:hypothetical protein